MDYAPLKIFLIMYAHIFVIILNPSALGCLKIPYRIWKRIFVQYNINKILLMQLKKVVNDVKALLNGLDWYHTQYFLQFRVFKFVFSQIIILIKIKFLRITFYQPFDILALWNSLVTCSCNCRYEIYVD